MLVLDAAIHVAGPHGTRIVAAGDFFTGLFETALRPEEVITAIRIPVVAGTRAAYRKFRHPASGYAVAGVAVDLAVDRGRCTGGRIAVNGVATHAFRATQAEALLAGYQGSDESHTERVLDAAFDGVAFLEDRFADAAYRRQLARTMLRRALADAMA
jgi:carbon-monoxide dehydrogenase medium subunit